MTQKQVPTSSSGGAVPVYVINFWPPLQLVAAAVRALRPLKKRHYIFMGTEQRKDPQQILHRKALTPIISIHL
jgi:hypothetical protein